MGVLLAGTAIGAAKEVNRDVERQQLYCGDKTPAYALGWTSIWSLAPLWTALGTCNKNTSSSGSRTGMPLARTTTLSYSPAKTFHDWSLDYTPLSLEISMP